MTNTLPANNHSWAIFLCGGGEEICAIRESVAQLGRPVFLYGELAGALEASQKMGRVILFVDRATLRTSETGKAKLKINLKPSIRMLAVGSESSYEDALELVSGGVAGFIEASTAPESLRKILESLERGELWVSRKLLTTAVLNQVSGEDSLLTRREWEILRKIAAGHKNRQIADELFITRDTVRWHLRSIYGKLGVHDRNAASGVMSLHAAPSLFS